MSEKIAAMHFPIQLLHKSMGITGKMVTSRGYKKMAAMHIHGQLPYKSMKRSHGTTLCPGRERLHLFTGSAELAGKRTHDKLLPPNCGAISQDNTVARTPAPSHACPCKMFYKLAT